jgi:hypothetical protein
MHRSRQRAPDANTFSLKPTQGLVTWGICSAPFLNHAFKTTEFTITLSIHDDGSWGYEVDTVLHIVGQSEPFHHVDKNRLMKAGAARPNPLAAWRARGGSGNYCFAPSVRRRPSPTA